MKTNILITGATGFIGQNLLKQIPAKYQIHLLLSPKKHNEHFDFPTLVFNNNIEELANYFKENNIEGIVHLASFFVSQHQSEQCEGLIYSNVFLGTALLEAAKHSNVKWFLNTGTYWQHYHSDSEEYNPVNLYAATKQALIDIAQYYKEVTRIKFVTLKLCDTYGIGDPRKKIMAIFKQISITGETLKMSKGEQQINILYVDDVVDGFITLIDMLHNDDKLQNEYVLRAPQNYTLKCLAEIFEKVSQKKLNIEFGGRPYREREVMVPWNKGTIVPGWYSKINIYDGIRKFLSVE